MNIEDLGGLVKTVPLITLPEDERQRLELNLTVEMVIIQSKCLMDVCGQKQAQEILVSVGEKVSQRFLDLIAEKTESDPSEHGIDEIVQAMDCYFGRKAVTIEDDEGKIIREISECPFKDAPIELCHTMKIIANNIFSKIDPNSTFEYLSMMTNGSPTCIYAVMKTRPEKVGITLTLVKLYNNINI
jgi:predicted ArsR family transcriptional regulator